MAGYIKDHRKELDSQIWQMPPLYHRLWQWLKYSVNHTDKAIPMFDGSEMLVKRGQRLTSLREIAKGISWHEGKNFKMPNPKTISSILAWMVKAEMISTSGGKGNKQYTLITLMKYDFYNEKPVTGNAKVTASKQPTDINNNDNEKRLYADFVQMTPKQHASLLKDLGEEVVQKYILTIDDWFAQDDRRLKKYSDHSRMVRTWKRSDDEKLAGGRQTHKKPISVPVPQMSDEEREFLQSVASKQAERNGVSPTHYS